GKIGKRPGPLDHDDLVTRAATADDVNELWLTDITEHWTDEGELYLCAIDDVFSGRIVGYSALEICLGTGELHPQVEYCLDRGQQVRDRGVGGGSEIDRHLLTGACFHLLRGNAEGRGRLVADPVGAREVCRMTTQQIGRRGDPLPFEGAGGKAPEGDLRAELLHVGLSQQLLGPSTDGCTSRVVDVLERLLQSIAEHDRAPHGVACSDQLTGAERRCMGGACATCVPSRIARNVGACPSQSGSRCPVTTSADSDGSETCCPGVPGAGSVISRGREPSASRAVAACSRQVWRAESRYVAWSSSC